MKKIYLLLGLVLLSSCEDVVEVTLPSNEAPLAVDAWLFHQPTTQTIFLKKANTYFDTSEPEGVAGASVSVTELSSGRIFSFVESTAAKGEYEWLPSHANDTFGVIGEYYKLHITVGAEKYDAISQLNAVPKVDSITWSLSVFYEPSDQIYAAEFWAMDLEGEGDYYWISAWKNGKLLDRPDEIIISNDGSLSTATSTDGNSFIFPVRTGINRILDSDEAFYNLGDSVYVEIRSITDDAYFFLNTAVEQIDRPGGFGEVFTTTTLANIASNITSSTNNQVVGFFCVSATSGLGRRFTQEAIKED